MVLVIGQENCVRCNITKNILDKNKIQYEYKKITDLSQEQQEKYMKIAEDKNLLNFPIIIVNDLAIELNDLIKKEGE
jgi:glutaredoxin